MANTASAKKRARQTEKRRTHNISKRSAMRTAIKVVYARIAVEDSSGAEAAYVKAASGVDRAASDGIIHKNKAARHKSRLYQRVQALAKK